eukprot:COSAG02_NODE_4382_length_5425_cov_4.122043_4_plen_59_part_00
MTIPVSFFGPDPSSQIFSKSRIDDSYQVYTQYEKSGRKFLVVAPRDRITPITVLFRFP